MNIKINNARELAHRAIDTINDGGNWRGAALLITKQAADGRTACAAVLATMLELWDRDMPAYNRAHFAEAVLTYAISGNSNPRRHKEWIRAFYWLRDGTDGVTADYAQLVTLGGHMRHFRRRIRSSRPAENRMIVYRLLTPRLRSARLPRQRGK